MVQIISKDMDKSMEHINLSINESDFDFLKAEDITKKKALEKCDHPMILSWNNSKTGEYFPNHECGVHEKPFWVRYAEGRGANMTVDFNNGEYTFMVLKM